MIPKETIDLIIDTSRIEEVVGDYVTLKKKTGAYILGLCPFHNEKSPSFTVTPSRGIYKCFGCGKAGNSIDFMMEIEKYSYPEALRYLAKKYNIEIAEEVQSDEQIAEKNERESIFAVTAFAQKYFTENLLQHEEGKAIGLSYFKERGFRDDIVEKFQLGYSLEKRNAFTEAALEAGFKLEFLVKAGLSILPEKEQGAEHIENKAFDRFSGRVLFPIHNTSGRVIAFGGRTLRSDKKVAKYINSPETEIYHKSNVLYGAFFAKRSIVEKDTCYLVEGYTDVTSIVQAGIDNVVASSGTSLTIEQIRLIRRYTKNITILYDGDNAGIKASFRGIDLVLEEGMNVKVLLFPDGDDPDSYSKKVSSEELKNFLATKAVDFITFKTGLLVNETKNDPIKKAELIRNIVETIALIPDPIYRSVYVKECSTIMAMNEQVLLSELNKIRRQNSKKDTGAEQNFQTEEVLVEQFEKIENSDDSEFQERDIIRLLIQYGKDVFTLSYVDENKKTVSNEVKVAEYICHELTVDSIQLENEVYNIILNEFVSGVEKEDIPYIPHFTKHPNSEVQKVVIDIIALPYSLAKWEEKKKIVVPKEISSIADDVVKSVLSLKIKRIHKMSADNQKKLQEVNDDQQLIELLEHEMKLQKIKMEFAAKYGTAAIIK